MQGEGDVLLKLCLIVGFITKQLVDGSENDILQDKLVDRPGDLQPRLFQ